MTQRSIPTLRLPLAIRHPIALYRGAGILTCFPSATHLCLTLGADSPCADERCAGNLGLTARETFTPFIATHVSILTSDTSSMPYDTPSMAYRTLSYHDSVHQTTLLSISLDQVKGSLCASAPSETASNASQVNTVVRSFGL